MSINEFKKQLEAEHKAEEEAEQIKQLRYNREYEEAEEHTNKEAEVLELKLKVKIKMQAYVVLKM
ncbi:hypothetical protein EWM64_g5580 [Hericium alpestre]|uniref:Uncharacterized protein n=1 Tax=Hericium alpestre TaxID=135208 RepID=A0A4Y9ZWJ3_9AGAM|nr:hypothetical protein EWM64_g5580 [Hericium alpestre]